MSGKVTRCAGEGCRKPVPSLALRYGDSFCSSTCARKHYGTFVEKGIEGGRRRKYDGPLAA